MKDNGVYKSKTDLNTKDYIGRYIEDGELPEALHVRNANSRLIFKNQKLTCQFLKTYLHIPLFSNISPEDIEDVTERYQAFLGIEFEADTIKRVRLRYGEQSDKFVYVIPLIEHKSSVDYDVAMQILRYMTVVWHDYARQMNAIHKDISHTKNFRYPLIIPIIYYEGADAWTADWHLRDRIEFGEMMKEYLPDFMYNVVEVHKYTNEELESIHDEMSLIMMFNKIQTAKDYSELMNVSRFFVNSVYDKASDDIKKIYTDILWSLLIRMNVPVKDAQQMIEVLEASGMGYLFENMEKIDIQAERRHVMEEREKAEIAKAEAEAAKAEAKTAKAEIETAKAEIETAKAEIETAKAEAKTAKAEVEIAKAETKIAREKIEHIIKRFILKFKADGYTKEEAKSELQVLCGLDEIDAAEKIAAYWNEQ